MRAVVVGGGIAGLAAARRLESLSPDVEIVLLERDDVLGGKLRTEHVGAFTIEGGADSFLSRKERGIGLCRELGLADRTVKVHVTAVLTALRVSSRTKAVVAAGKLGLSPDALLAGPDS